MEKADAPIWIDGLTYVCDVPPALGKITALVVKNGKVVASTESGIEMIVPTHRPISP